jgi:hypothetical protein
VTTRLPAPARAIASAVTTALDRVGERDVEAFEDSAAILAATDQAGLVQGTVVRMLLEELHPDGLDGDDVQAVLERCTRTSLEWLPDVDPHALLVLLASALGVYDPDADESPPRPAALARHAPLLVADLLAARRAGADRYLTAAFADIARAETMEAP